MENDGSHFITLPHLQLTYGFLDSTVHSSVHSIWTQTHTSLITGKSKGSLVSLLNSQLQKTDYSLHRTWDNTLD